MLYSMLTHFLKLQDIIAYRSQSNDTIPMNPFSRSQVIVFWGGKVANIMRCLRYLGPLFMIQTDINLAWAGLFLLVPMFPAGYLFTKQLASRVDHVLPFGDDDIMHRSIHF